MQNPLHSTKPGQHALSFPNPHNVNVPISVDSRLLLPDDHSGPPSDDSFGSDFGSGAEDDDDLLFNDKDLVYVGPDPHSDDSFGSDFGSPAEEDDRDLFFNDKALEHTGAGPHSDRAELASPVVEQATQPPKKPTAANEGDLNHTEHEPIILTKAEPAIILRAKDEEQPPKKPQSPNRRELGTFEYKQIDQRKEEPPAQRALPHVPLQLSKRSTPPNDEALGPELPITSKPESANPHRLDWSPMPYNWDTGNFGPELPVSNKPEPSSTSTNWYELPWTSSSATLGQPPKITAGTSLKDLGYVAPKKSPPRQSEPATRLPSNKPHMLPPTSMLGIGQSPQKPNSHKYKYLEDMAPEPFVLPRKPFFGRAEQPPKKPAAPSSSMCIICQKRPCYNDGQKSFPTCGYVCAAKMKDTKQHYSAAGQLKMCEVCNVRPRCSKAGTIYSTCGLSCAAKLRPPGAVDMCDFCNERPKVVLNGKVFPQCGRTCRDKAKLAEEETMVSRSYPTRNAPGGFFNDSRET